MTTINNGGRIGGGRESRARTSIGIEEVAVLLALTLALLHPGDSLITTCHFQNDTNAFIFSGFGTGDEMCIHFVYAWPAGVLYGAGEGAGQLACSAP